MKLGYKLTILQIIIYSVISTYILFTMFNLSPLVFNQFDQLFLTSNNFTVVLLFCSMKNWRLIKSMGFVSFIISLSFNGC